MRAARHGFRIVRLPLEGCRPAGCWRRSDKAVELRSIRRCPTGEYPLGLISRRKGNWCMRVRSPPPLRRVRLTVSSTPFKRRHEGSTPSRGTEFESCRRRSKAGQLRRCGQSWRRPPAFQAGDCGFDSRQRHCGVEEFGCPQLPHKQKTAGSNPASATKAPDFGHPSAQADGCR
jgi:hypothetical protein